MRTTAPPTRSHTVWPRFTVLVAIMIGVAACSSGEGTRSQTEGDGRRVVIVDYSPTQSDVGALLYVLQQQDLEVGAITIPGTGEAHCGNAVATTLGILEVLERSEIPVACGREEPLAGSNAFPDAWRAAADAMEGLDVPEVGGGDLGNAVDLLRRTILESDLPVTLLTLGPLTNIGEAISAHPELIAHLDHVYVMGGAVHVEGNVFDSPAAEWNVWVDPHSASLLLASGARITLVPLDATNYVPVDRSVFRALWQPNPAPALAMMRGIASASPEWYGGGFFLWDELAAGVMVENSYVTFATERIVVEETGADVGRTRADPGGHEVRVAVSADRARFTNDLVSAWAGNEVTVFEPAGTAEADYAEALQRAADAYAAAQEAGFAAAEAENPEFTFDAATSIETAREFFATLAPHIFAASEDLSLSLAGIEPPPGLEEHDAYVEALAALPLAWDDITALIESAATFAELDGIGANDAVHRVAEACRALQEAVGAYGLTVDLSCQ